MSRVLGDTAGAIGDTKHSMLTLAQIQALYGPGWVLADGSSCAGTKYSLITGNSNLPDPRGYYLRAKDHGAGVNPDGDLPEGQHQSDQFTFHSHGGGTGNAGGHTHSINRAKSNPGGNTIRLDTPAGNFLVNQDASDVLNILGVGDHSHSINGQGGNETRSKAMTVNIFIRVN